MEFMCCLLIQLGFASLSSSCLSIRLTGGSSVARFHPVSKLRELAWRNFQSSTRRYCFVWTIAPSRLLFAGLL
ncbi:hypothetical protein B0T19DRAFT_125996 [Cercophora scortea]|uniref:Secreted protein n=1 Tax=Cercophora scortea TaxID=314031 RepID=A0AAE0MJ03_9PEZI|nr:hypothetical protein B0T19DRAFT_125996 [Cercophora scortea]